LRVGERSREQLTVPIEVRLLPRRRSGAERWLMLAVVGRARRSYAVAGLLCTGPLDPRDFRWATLLCPCPCPCPRVPHVDCATGSLGLRTLVRSGLLPRTVGAAAPYGTVLVCVVGAVWGRAEGSQSLESCRSLDSALATLTASEM